ncbi:hypothetical protein U1Q18_029709 [Sarracenia purpurea var. burkii]
MQQSKAFKILRTRLKTVPSYSFSGNQFKLSPASSYSQIHHLLSVSQLSEDGDMDGDLHNGINFASRLQQFEQMQQQHRSNSKSMAQSRYSSDSSCKELTSPKEPARASTTQDTTRPPSRSSRKGPGQLQL